jgi:hypothetical protein
MNEAHPYQRSPDPLATHQRLSQKDHNDRQGGVGGHFQGTPAIQRLHYSHCHPSAAHKAHRPNRLRINAWPSNTGITTPSTTPRGNHRHAAKHVRRISRLGYSKSQRPFHNYCASRNTSRRTRDQRECDADSVHGKTQGCVDVDERLVRQKQGYTHQLPGFGKVE